MLRQTYSLAHLARGKLSHEAARADHQLRILVGHANLLDNLMIDLAEAEREQESWFNASLQSATQSQRRIQWADAVIAHDTEEEYDSTSDSDSEDDEEEQEISSVSRVPLHKEVYPEQDEEPSEDDLEEDYESLSLMRTPSRSSLSPPSSPPELSHDIEEEDSSEDDEYMPPSPTATPISTTTLSEKEREQLVTTFLDHDYYLLSRTAPTTSSAISAY